jgi:hypothetical protein
MYILGHSCLNHYFLKVIWGKNLGPSQVFLEYVHWSTCGLLGIQEYLGLPFKHFLR